MGKWLKAIKRNSELEKEKAALIKEQVRLSQRIGVLETSVFEKEKQAESLIQIEKEYNKLKGEARSFYKNELLMSSMKIIAKLLNEEKPLDSLVRQQMEAQHRLAKLQSQPLYSGRASYNFNNLSGLPFL